MAEITAKMVMDLRKATGAGMMDCKNALVESEGDFDKAIEILRKKGQKVAAKRADRESSEGAVIAMVNGSNTVGAIISLNCETDFVAKNDDFQNLAKELCMQIAAANPLYISIEDVPESDIEKEKELINNEGLPNIGEQ